MTNEKAIMCLEDMKIKVPIPKAAKQARENNEALDVAIKALAESEHGTNLASLGTDCSEFPNNSDAISRQSVIDVLDETKRIARQNIDGAVLITFERVLDSLVNIANALPTIQPERKECEEREQGKCPWYAG